MDLLKSSECFVVRLILWRRRWCDLMFLATPEGDLAAVAEAHVFVEFYCALVGEGYVKEGGNI